MEEFGRSLFLALFDAYPATKAFFPFVDPATGEPEDKELRRHGKTVASSIGEVIGLLQVPRRASMLRCAALCSAVPWLPAALAALCCLCRRRLAACRPHGTVQQAHAACRERTPRPPCRRPPSCAAH